METVGEYIMHGAMGTMVAMVLALASMGLFKSKRIEKWVDTSFPSVVMALVITLLIGCIYATCWRDAGMWTHLMAAVLGFIGVGLMGLVNKECKSKEVN